MDSQQNIRHDDLVKVTFLLVLKEEVRPPDLVRICEHEVPNLAVHVVKLETTVHPLLAESDLNRVFLAYKQTDSVRQCTWKGHESTSR